LPPRNVLFNQGNAYLVSSVYNCLDERIPETVINIVRTIAVDEAKIQHPKEEVILIKEVRPLVKLELELYYDENEMKEWDKAKVQGPAIIATVKQSLLSNFAWVSNLMDTKKIQTDCTREAYARMDFSPIFHLKKDLFAEMVETQICSGIESSREFNGYLEQQKTTLVQKSQENLEAKLNEMGRARAGQCVKQYPVDTNLNRVKFKKEREACLVDHWPKLEAELLKNFSNDPLTKKFNISEEGVKERLNFNRRRIQLKIFKDLFQGP
jgi:hypothetical protein